MKMDGTILRFACRAMNVIEKREPCRSREAETEIAPTVPIKAG